MPRLLPVLLVAGLAAAAQAGPDLMGELLTLRNPVVLRVAATPDRATLGVHSEVLARVTRHDVAPFLEAEGALDPALQAELRAALAEAQASVDNLLRGMSVVPGPGTSEALAAGDVYHDWVLSLSSRVLRGTLAGPGDRPVVQPEVAARFLTRAVGEVDRAGFVVRLACVGFLVRHGGARGTDWPTLEREAPELAADYQRVVAGQVGLIPEDDTEAALPLLVRALTQALPAGAGGPAAASTPRAPVVPADARLPEARTSAPGTTREVRRETREASAWTMDGSSFLLVYGLTLAGFAGLWGWRRPAPSPTPTPTPAAPPESSGKPASRNPDSEATAPGAATRPSSGGGGPVAATSGRVPDWVRGILAGKLEQRFQDGELLGAGGMGCVVATRDAVLDRRVALKFPPPHLVGVPELRERFLREARALARLDHPAVVRVHDVLNADEGGTPVMVMEYLEGEDLAARLARHGPPALAEAVAWVDQAAAGLSHAHEAGVCHRDIKPANLIRVGEQVKVLDFGLAGFDDAEGLTRTGVRMGSAAYMAPEQISGERPGKASDQFALAATAYELFTGSAAFEGPGRDLPEPASQRRAGVPAAFDAVLARALAARPEDRYPDLEAFRAALAEAWGRARA